MKANLLKLGASGLLLAAAAYADPAVQLIGTSGIAGDGNLSVAIGQSGGWGFRISNDNATLWIGANISDFCPSSVSAPPCDTTTWQLASIDPFGPYTDLFGTNFVTIAPGDTLTETFDPGNSGYRQHLAHRPQRYQCWGYAVRTSRVRLRFLRRRPQCQRQPARRRPLHVCRRQRDRQRQRPGTLCGPAWSSRPRRRVLRPPSAVVRSPALSRAGRYRREATPPVAAPHPHALDRRPHHAQLSRVFGGCHCGVVLGTQWSGSPPNFAVPNGSTGSSQPNLQKRERSIGGW